MKDATNEAKQRLAEQEQALENLKGQLAEQERVLDQFQANYSRLRLEHAALSDHAATLRQELAQATQDRDYLQQNLAHFEEDLRALQNTRTVRATRWAGQMLRSLKSKVASLRPENSDQPSSGSNQHPAFNTRHPAFFHPSSFILHPYYKWITENEPSANELDEQRQKAAELAYCPLISIIMPVYNPAPEVLAAAIASVQSQTYDRWELCVADASTTGEVSKLLEEASHHDERIRVRFLAHNGGITANSNAALELARGEFCAFLDHDDTLAPSALFEVAQALNSNNRLDLIYSDLDLLSEDGGQRFDPLFKPDWSPEIILSANYLTHLTVIRTALIRELGSFAPGTEGAQDWDLFLRLVEKTEQIHHIPKVLYHWRQSSGSTAGNIYNKPEVPQTQLRVIEAHLKRRGIDGKAFFDKSGFIRVSWPIAGNPKVSIIIPTKDKLELLGPCLQSILDKTSYSNYEVLVVDTGSTSPEVASYYQELAAEPRVKILKYEWPFNYSAVNNWAAKQSEGELLLFLNNDTEVIGPDWLEEMVRWGQRPEVGLVGAKLLKPDGAIQHAGVIVGLGGYAGHIFAGMPEGCNTIFGYTEWYRDFSAVTAACMLVRRALFEELGGFEEAFKLNGSDVDLGLRARAKGYRVIFNPFARLYHLESATHQGQVPFSDYRLSQERYRPLLESGDPYFNPNLSYNKAVPSFK
jgi:glycosyltransferase involved in cell wall biosynthesis